MTTPICHRTLDTRLNPSHDGSVTIGGPCIGSRCSMWVPVVRGKEGTSLSTYEGIAGEESDIDKTSGSYNPHDTEPTGEGLCIENLRATPWPDPAREPE